MESDTATETGNSNPKRSTPSRRPDQAAATAQRAVDPVADPGRPAVARIASNAHEAVDRIAGVAAHAAESLGLKGDQLKAAQSEFVKGTRNYVSEHPVAALGIAVATGYVVSRLLSNR